MGSGNLGCELDLHAVIDGLSNHLGGDLTANFNGDSMVVIRLRESSPAVILYRTGTFQIRGAKTIEKLEAAKDETISVLGDIGVPINNPTFEPLTAVFMGDLDQSVPLEVLALALGLEQTEYEPEQFPGLIYRPIKNPSTALIFASGKVIVSGVKDPEIAEALLENLRERLRQIGS